MGHPDVGVFLYVYQKLATTGLLKTAACSWSDNLIKPDEDEAHSKSCLDITVSDENVIRLLHLHVPLQGRYTYTKLLQLLDGTQSKAIALLFMLESR